MGQNSNKERLEQRNRELSILNTIANALNSSVKLNDALQAALEHVAGLLALHTGWVWLLREESEASYLAAALNLPPALAHKPHRMEGSCYCLDTYRTDDLNGAANVNVIECTRLNKLVDGTDGLRYHASIPLYAHGKKLGVLNVASQDWRELSPDDLRLLYTVGDLLSIAIERARLFEASRKLGALEERNRLAREIHDTIAQGLTAIILHLELAETLLPAESETERLQRAVRQALLLTRANLEEARRSVLDLRAAPLEGRTLGDALAELCHTFQAEGRMIIQFQAVGDRPLSARLEAGLYRMAQEALNNIRHHAQATQVIMELLVTPQQLILTIEDNGRGFDLDNIPPNRFGLTGLNERANLLGGTFRLESELGEGTKMEAIIPITG
ncbi:MAG: GAF domain-containing sensor histidine kinase [Chloroflexi bacterium]|nr:GAF domain-containing sensor histidine kinase [Chloroflexota bacterium]MBP8054838.1 GAF domain-containing sensor histidine kinase [Chloroflexota bacterium]